LVIIGFVYGNEKVGNCVKRHFIYLQRFGQFHIILGQCFDTLNRFSWCTTCSCGIHLYYTCGIWKPSSFENLQLSIFELILESTKTLVYVVPLSILLLECIGFYFWGWQQREVSFHLCIYVLQSGCQR